MRDPSQIPIERLAQLLLQCARDDAALPRRTPANDDALHAQYIDDMYNRLEALPELRRDIQTMPLDPDASLPVAPPAAAASNEDLEQLVAIALTSAQDAEDLSREANAASRRARRGMFVAVGLAAAGMAVAGAMIIGVRIDRADNQQMTAIATQVQALDLLQHRINEQLVELQAARAVQDTGATQSQAGVMGSQTGESAGQPLAPLKATAVSVVPAEPAMGQTTAAQTTAGQTAAGANGQQAQGATRPAAYTPAAIYAAELPAPPPPAYAPRGTYERHVTSYRPVVRRYRPQVPLPRPVAFIISSVQRDVRTLFR